MELILQLTFLFALIVDDFSIESLLARDTYSDIWGNTCLPTDSTSCHPTSILYDALRLFRVFQHRPRSRESQWSAGTYSSTDLDTAALPWPTSSYQSTYGNCPSPWTAEDMSESTPINFANIFPSSKPLYICHDSTTLDGNMNLRISSDMASTTRGQADYI
jgi:hypothetical protein